MPAISKELSLLVKFMRKNGILKYKKGTMEIEIAQSSFILPVSKKKNSKTPSSVDLSTIDDSSYSDEEILMWSSSTMGDGPEAADAQNNSARS